MLSKFFKEELEDRQKIENNPSLAFEKDFLRFMLSDGAAALYLSNKKESENSLKIDWIKTYSYANSQPACMYMWAEKETDGDLKGWKYYTPDDFRKHSIWSLKQDVKQLNEFSMLYFVDAVESALKSTQTNTADVAYMIPHISSMYFYEKLNSEFKRRHIDLPTSKWFTNLTTVGNIGSASPFVALDEFIKTQKLRKGEKILLAVPESGRFSCGLALLTSV